MHIIETAFLSVLAAVWILQAFRAYRGMSQVPRLSSIAPAAGTNLPRISILFAARNEARNLPRALTSFLALDYPDLEVIAVNDRSEDSTAEILESFAAQDARLRVIHIQELPEGWLGKPYGLETAYQQATGEWLVFTDADVSFAPDLLRRALALVEKNGLEHLTLLAAVEMRGFWETTVITYLGFCFVFGIEPWRVSDPKAGSYMGVGAFQMIHRATYEAIGTHRRLAMEVVDDMKLGKLVKQGDFRSSTAFGEQWVHVRWQEGIGNVIRGMTKNLFAGFGYRTGKALGSVGLLFVVSIAPFIALFASGGASRVAAAVSVAVVTALEAALLRGTRASPLYGLTHPLGALIFCYMILRSMGVTLWRGGVVWRGTFYPLEELKRGLV